MQARANKTTTGPLQKKLDAQKRQNQKEVLENVSKENRDRRITAEQDAIQRYN